MKLLLYFYLAPLHFAVVSEFIDAVKLLLKDSRVEINQLNNTNLFFLNNIYYISNHHIFNPDRVLTF